MATIPLKDITFPGLDNTYTIPEIDNTLSTAGKAADAKKTGDEIDQLKSDLNNTFSLKVDFDTDSAIDNAYANITNGNVYTQSDYSYIHVPVIGGETIIYQSGSTESVAGIVFYDSIGNYISGVAGTQFEQYITIPKFAKTAKIDYRTARINNFHAYMIIKAETIYESVSDSISNNQAVVVDINGSGDYTSILEALKYTPTTVPIYIKKGVYNVITEYETEYGSDFFTNYSGYRLQTDPFLRGLWLGHGRKVYGESGVEIQCVYSGNNGNVNEYFSAIANAGETTLENVKITFGGIRYAIHDDFTNGAIEANSSIKWKNIIFDGTPYMNSVIGGGMGIDIDFEINGCVFLNNTKDWDINYHGSNSSNTNNINTIKVTDCFGSRRCGVWDNGSATTISTMYVSNSRFMEIVHYRSTSSTGPENTALIAWCNVSP